MRVLVSTSDKTGLIEFLKPLEDLGLELVSTGGTFNFLKDNNFSVKEVSAVTGFPEVLDGRVKTLHPAVHMGLLADKTNPKHMEQLNQQNIKAFDMVVGNLYPFEKTALNSSANFDDLIENIDIGGPSFLRSAAKNFKSVIVVSSPTDYLWVQKKIISNTLNDEDRKKLAVKVFSLTAYYDSLIVNKLASGADELEYLNLPLKKRNNLRYGENAQQSASWFFNPLELNNFANCEIHQGKELSYNNLLDLDAAVGLVKLYEHPACVAVKHNNPCGVGVANEIANAAKKAIEADPKSIFGGVVAVNTIFDLQTAEQFKDIFLECIIAPEFTAESLKYFSHKKNLRLISLKTLMQKNNFNVNYKSIAGGVLFQETDSFKTEAWKFLSEKPTDRLMSTMIFGEKLAGFLKSNSIAIVANEQSVGLGMGQVNRVDAVEQALARMLDAQARLKFNMKDVVLVSDAFFPFADSIDLISKYGINWVVQPGGSVQDEKVFSAAKLNQINMVITNRRHFRH